jgi:hypothetical protein
MRNLIGSKARFGIEYEIHPGDSHILGNMRLWLEGQYNGSFEDVTMLASVAFLLEDSDRRMPDGRIFANEAADQVYGRIDALPDGNGHAYVCLSGEGFDDFITYGYTRDDKIHFVWKLCDEPSFEHPGYPEGVQSATVSVDEFRSVVAEFAAAIELAGKERPKYQARLKEARQRQGRKPLAE